MKKFFNTEKAPIIVGIFGILFMIMVLVILISTYSIASANLGKQQQWTSDKNSFDRAYEIAAADKETPDKTLSVPNLCNQLGNTINQAIDSIGQGASVVSITPINDRETGAINQTVINLTNESGNEKSGTPNVVAFTDKSEKIVKISFTCNTWLLGYGEYSFVDMIDNEHIVENTLNEAGLNVEIPSVCVPNNRASYTNYDSDGTTVISEICNFDGSHWQDRRNYKWSSTLNFDYSYANAKSDLVETIRIITISVQ